MKWNHTVISHAWMYICICNDSLVLVFPGTQNSYLYEDLASNPLLLLSNGPNAVSCNNVIKGPDHTH